MIHIDIALEKGNETLRQFSWRDACLADFNAPLQVARWKLQHTKKSPRKKAVILTQRAQLKSAPTAKCISGEQMYANVFKNAAELTLLNREC